MPTEATIASVIISKYADHLPLYPQSQIYARQGVDIDSFTLALWVSKAAHELKPVHDAMLAHLKSPSKLFMNETGFVAQIAARRDSLPGFSVIAGLYEQLDLYEV